MKTIYKSLMTIAFLSRTVSRFMRQGIKKK